MDIEVVVAALGNRFDPTEAEVIEQVMRERGGIITDGQFIEEAALPLATRRRGRR